MLSAFFAFVLLVGVRGFEFSPARRLLGHRGSDSLLRLSFTSALVQILLQQKTKAIAFVLLVGVRGFEFSPARRLLGHRGSDSLLRLSFTSALVQILLQQKTKAIAFVLLVGVRGFEPPASWSRTKHSTKLSHTPINILFFLCRYISARRIL